MLRKKSLVELRGIAQSFGIPDIFQMDVMQLAQAIEAKQEAMAPAPKIEIPKPEYDARLMTKPPSKRSSKEDMELLLKPYTERGMRLSFDENNEMWYMEAGKKNDQGTMRMPLRVVLDCARRLMA